ncbi:MAG: FtsX-like permease family protein, partial [Oscillospiraceae bacterium]
EEYVKLNKIKVDKKEEKGYDQAKVKVTDIQYVAEVEQAIKDMGFETNSMESIRKPMEENVNKQQMFLGVIAGVSLFVAALGIANTMLMSIYERTREIGIMKVVGCYVKDIRTIFLMEAGCIGFMGGVAGIILSYIISFLMNYFGFSTGMGGTVYPGQQQAAGAVSIIPPWLVLGALAFSTVIGVVSGYYPANRAVKISALTAIKQE